MKRLALLLLATLLAATSASALAGGRHHGHRHGHSHLSLGFHIGVPLGWSHPWYWGPPVYYAPAPVVVQPAAPTVYVERSDVVPEGTASWYFCREANAYYPYVKQCPGGWQRVPAQPPQ
jgi:hypothetical protein